MSQSAKELAADLNKLIKARAPDITELSLNGGKPLPELPARAQIGAAFGVARIGGGGGGSTEAPDDEIVASNGIASPLTETARTLHSTQVVSSDGLFVWSVPASITMVDAEGRTVVFEYAAP